MSVPEGYELREVGMERLDEIGLLRARVWKELGALIDTDLDDKGRFIDEWERVSRHWAILFEGNVVACARLTVGDSPSNVPHGLLAMRKGCELAYPLAAITRLVVAPEHRRKGLATLLDEIRISEALRVGARAVIGVTRTRHETLAKMGFAPIFELTPDDAEASVGFRGGGQTGYLLST